jgi:RecB family exonuclease
LPILKHRVHTALPEKRPEIQPLEWNPWAQRQLVGWAERGISPSAWNTFMACKRDFYYKYILKLHEQDEFEDEMTASTFGTIVHKVLEDGFADLKNRVLQPNDLKALKGNIEKLLHSAVADEYSLALTESGENYLHFAMAEATLHKLIDVELRELEGSITRTVTALEAELGHAWTLEDSPFSSIRLHGKADRIDLEDGQVVVTDYKTGTVKAHELVLKEDWIEKVAKGKSSKALQLLIYSAIALETLGPNGGPIDSVQSGIRSGKNARVGLLSLHIDGRIQIERSDAQRLLRWLVEQLESLHGHEGGIEHAPEARYCAYCTVLDPVPNFFN